MLASAASSTRAPTSSRRDKPGRFTGNAAPMMSAETMSA